MGNGKWSVGRVVGSPVGAVDVAIGQYTVGDMKTARSSFGLRGRNIERPELDIGCGWNFICRDGGGDPWLEFQLVAGLELVGELLVSDRVSEVVWVRFECIFGLDMGCSGFVLR